jgi:hypothetical protein
VLTERRLARRLGLGVLGNTSGRRASTSNIALLLAGVRPGRSRQPASAAPVNSRAFGTRQDEDRIGPQYQANAVCNKSDMKNMKEMKLMKIFGFLHVLHALHDHHVCFSALQCAA